MVVHQVLGAANVRDAVSDEARQFRSLFRSWGWRGRDHAGWIPVPLTDIEPFDTLRAETDDILLIHHSARMPQLAALLSLPNPKLLLYHNITPPEYLWDDAPLVAGHCAIGRAQLPALARAADVAAAHSEFSARELAAAGAERTTVLPLLVDLERLGPAVNAAGPGVAQPTVLFVGRLAPHKRQDELITTFALYRDRHAPGARLALIGPRESAPFAERLAALGQRLAPGAVTIESDLSVAELGARYRDAAVFVCLSEHEGFGVPLLEAFQVGVPVIARPNAAIPEVAGDAAILLEDRDPAVLAELIHVVVTDQDLRAELVRRGRRRVHDYAATDLAGRLRELIESVAVSRR